MEFWHGVESVPGLGAGDIDVEFLFCWLEGCVFVFADVHADDGLVEGGEFAALSEDKGVWSFDVVFEVVFLGEFCVIGVSNAAVFVFENKVDGDEVSFLGACFFWRGCFVYAWYFWCWCSAEYHQESYNGY